MIDQIAHFIVRTQEVLGAETSRQIVNTVVLIAVLTLIRTLAIRRITALEFKSPEARMRAVVWIRNGLVFVMFLGLFVIWATELRTLAFSLFAVMAAVVVATKEIILCVSGGFYRTWLKGCKVGDRIEIAGHRGDIIDQTVLTTTLLEVGPQQLTHQNTGRAVVLPNAIFLSAPMINETYTETYVAHTFQLPLKLEEDWQRAEQVLLEVCAEETKEYIAEAKRHMDELADNTGIDPPNVEARVIVKVPEAGKLSLVVRIAAPSRRKGRIEQQIVRRFLSTFYAPKPKA